MCCWRIGSLSPVPEGEGPGAPSGWSGRVIKIRATLLLCYVMYIMGSQAETIRQHLLERYFEPARRRGETLVTVRAGDIHKELGLRNRVPNVCQAMESRILERNARVRISSKQGPPKGFGTTLTITYAVEPGPETETIATSTENPPPYPSEGDRLWQELRGMGKEMFAKYGGGEAWLKRERANFYGPFKRKETP